MSQPCVKVTLGCGGKRVQRHMSVPTEMYADRANGERNRKRSIRDRLGGLSKQFSSVPQSTGTKRQKDIEGQWRHDMFFVECDELKTGGAGSESSWLFGGFGAWMKLPANNSASTNNILHDILKLQPLRKLTRFLTVFLKRMPYVIQSTEVYHFWKSEAILTTTGLTMLGLPRLFIGAYICCHLHCKYVNCCLNLTLFMRCFPWYIYHVCSYLSCTNPLKVLALVADVVYLGVKCGIRLPVVNNRMYLDPEFDMKEKRHGNTREEQGEILRRSYWGSVEALGLAKKYTMKSQENNVQYKLKFIISRSNELLMSLGKPESIHTQG